MSLDHVILYFPNELYQASSVLSPQSSHIFLGLKFSTTSFSGSANAIQPTLTCAHKTLCRWCKCSPADNMCAFVGGWTKYSLHCPHHPMWHCSDIFVCLFTLKIISCGVFLSLPPTRLECQCVQCVTKTWPSINVHGMLAPCSFESSLWTFESNVLEELVQNCAEKQNRRTL